MILGFRSKDAETIWRGEVLRRLPVVTQEAAHRKLRLLASLQTFAQRSAGRSTGYRRTDTRSSLGSRNGMETGIQGSTCQNVDPNQSVDLQKVSAVNSFDEVCSSWLRERR
ncbi:MAG: hypothetical protein WBM28_12580 [Burkholderiales bacterium]